MARLNKKKQEGSASGRQPTVFLLAQVGAHAALQYGQRLKKIRLSRPQSGILWNLSFNPSMTQRQLAARLGMLPSRLVVLLDELESRALIERRSDPHDRRRHRLHLTEKGRAMLGAIANVTAEHDRDLFAALSPRERKHLGALLLRVADEQGLTRGVHPGFARLRERSSNRNK